LFDMELSLVLVTEKTKGLIVDVKALGLTKDKIQAFSKKFMESINWKK
ncbi:MAG: hypothetical protein HQL25_09265, partial [Candidatus Omnitrophica bacterium]|nr:hypothetical protein [Candidatus Omnitrophota bacterium]